MVQTATNPETGERIQYIDGSWQPIPSATNPQTGQKAWKIGGEWQVEPAQPAQPAQVAQQPQGGIIDQALGHLQGIGQSYREGALLGYRDELDGLVRGTGRKALGMLQGEDKPWSEYYRESRDASRDQLAQYRKENPIISGGVEMTGGFGTGMVGGAATPALAGGSLLKAGGLGLLEGGLIGLGKSEADNLSDMALDTAVGSVLGLGGGMVGHGLGELIGRSPRLLPYIGRHFDFAPEGEMARQNVREAQRQGFKLTPAQKTGSEPLEILESRLKRNPTTAGRFANMRKHNQDLLQQKVNEQFGVRGKEVNLGKLAEINRKQFDAATKQKEMVGLGLDFQRKISRAGAEFRGVPGRDATVQNLVKRTEKDFLKLMDDNAGFITPNEYQRIHSGLGSDLNKAANAGDIARIKYYAKIMEALDDAVDESLKEGSSELFKAARKNYKTLTYLEKPGVMNVPAGEISVQSLANRLRDDRHGYLYGKSNDPVYTAARTSQAFKDSIGSSGTPEGTQPGLWPSIYNFTVGTGYRMMPDRLFGASGLGQAVTQGGMIPGLEALLDPSHPLNPYINRGQ